MQVHKTSTHKNAKVQLHQRKVVERDRKNRWNKGQKDVSLDFGVGVGIECNKEVGKNTKWTSKWKKSATSLCHQSVIKNICLACFQSANPISVLCFVNAYLQQLVKNVENDQWTMNIYHKYTSQEYGYYLHTVITRLMCLLKNIPILAFDQLSGCVTEINNSNNINVILLVFISYCIQTYHSTSCTWHQDFVGVFPRSLLWEDQQQLGKASEHKHGQETVF